jgi:hypothetical protein
MPSGRVCRHRLVITFLFAATLMATARARLPDDPCYVGCGPVVSVLTVIIMGPTGIEAYPPRIGAIILLPVFPYPAGFGRYGTFDCLAGSHMVTSKCKLLSDKISIATGMPSGVFHRGGTC